MMTNSLSDTKGASQALTHHSDQSLIIALSSCLLKQLSSVELLSKQVLFLHIMCSGRLVGQVIWILSWMSMNYTYLLITIWSALQRLTSFYPWANFSQPTLQKSAWPHHWVCTHVPMVLWHACQPCCDITLFLGWKLHHDWWGWQGPSPFAGHSLQCTPWLWIATSCGCRGSHRLPWGCMHWGRSGEYFWWWWCTPFHEYRLPMGQNCCHGCQLPQIFQWHIALHHYSSPCGRHSRGMRWPVSFETWGELN